MDCALVNLDAFVTRMLYELGGGIIWAWRLHVEVNFFDPITEIAIHILSMNILDNTSDIFVVLFALKEHAEHSGVFLCVATVGLAAGALWRNLNLATTKTRACGRVALMKMLDVSE
jgi:hypothetical protein